MKKIFFPGSFNPFTKGHEDILLRLLKLADYVEIGIGFNADKPHCLEEAERNADIIREYLQKNSLQERVGVKVYSGLTALEAKKAGATCMARGVRSCKDFEYEYDLAAANRDAFGIETLLIPADPSLSFVSSSMIRDIKSHGEDTIAKKYIP